LFATSYRARLRSARRISGAAAASAERRSALAQCFRFSAVVCALSNLATIAFLGAGLRANGHTATPTQEERSASA